MTRKFNSVVILNWNELEISKDSVRILLKEPNIEIIVVDNGSTDGSREYFKDIKGIKLIAFPENRGISVARNSGIDMAEGKNIFLLDGDILYIKGTIEEYQKILDKYPDAGCVGGHIQENLDKYGHNGTADPNEADHIMTTDYILEEGFPMIWCQYGLFRGDVLRKIKFIEIPPFNEAGYGLEDGWFWHDMVEAGYVSLTASKPNYYHQAHSGLKELAKAKVPDKVKERRALFDKRWGKEQDWYEILARGVNMKRRDNPQ